MENRRELFHLGIIEGFYGTPWSFETRAALAPFLKSLGYVSYTYAPKADPFFRRRWREPIPAEHKSQLSLMVNHFHAQKMEAGVGLSPFEAYLNYDESTRQQLKDRVLAIEEMGFDRLAILFDDMKGGESLAQKQGEIISDVSSWWKGSPLVMCPTYYSFDPILDKLFGDRSPTYLSDLGKALPEDVSVFWTGEMICSPGYSTEHLASVESMLGRPPLLWDNYPVNDGPKMCPFLHLKPMTLRPWQNRQHLSGHWVNPMNQAWLSLIPLGTMNASYVLKEKYLPMESFRGITTQLFGSTFAQYLEEDLPLLQEKGLSQISLEERNGLKDRYRGLYGTRAQLAVKEVLDWLDGRYTVTREVFLTQ